LRQPEPGTVPVGARVVSVRCGHAEQGVADYVEKLLMQTLEKQGVGAKTAAGYGRFVFGG